MFLFVPHYEKGSDNKIVDVDSRHCETINGVESEKGLDKYILSQLPSFTDAVALRQDAPKNGDIPGAVTELIGSDGSDCRECYETMNFRNNLIFIPKHFMLDNSSVHAQFPEIVSMGYMDKVVSDDESVEPFEPPAYQSFLSKVLSNTKHLILPSHNVREEYRNVSGMLSLSFDDMTMLDMSACEVINIDTFFRNIITKWYECQDWEQSKKESLQNEISKLVSETFTTRNKEPFKNGMSFIYQALSESSKKFGTGVDTMYNIVQFLSIFNDIALKIHFYIEGVNDTIETFLRRCVLSPTTKGGFERMSNALIKKVEGVKDLVTPILTNDPYTDILLVARSDADSYPTITDVYVGIYNGLSKSTITPNDEDDSVDECVYVQRLWDIGITKPTSDSTFSNDNNNTINANVKDLNDKADKITAEIEQLKAQMTGLSDSISSNMNNNTQNTKTAVRSVVTEKLESMKTYVQESTDSAVLSLTESVNELDASITLNTGLIVVLIPMCVAIVLILLFKKPNTKKDEDNAS